VIWPRARTLLALVASAAVAIGTSGCAAQHRGTVPWPDHQLDPRKLAGDIRLFYARCMTSGERTPAGILRYAIAPPHTGLTERYRIALIGVLSEQDCTKDAGIYSISCYMFARATELDCTGRPLPRPQRRDPLEVGIPIGGMAWERDGRRLPHGILAERRLADSIRVVYGTCMLGESAYPRSVIAMMRPPPNAPLVERYRIALVALLRGQDCARRAGLVHFSCAEFARLTGIGCDGRIGSAPRRFAIEFSPVR
jgi:hypothetical protein